MQQTGIHPMQRLKERLRELLTVMPPGSKIVYLDYPVHSNGGDMLIMKGTEAFFDAYGHQVIARYSALDCPQKLDIPGDAIIALHGGGNFGDLYAQHQELRERVVKSYPDHRIVILPQTIFYRSEEAYDRTAALFNRHRDLHLFVRDTLSYEKALTKFTGRVYLSPDMAHQLWPLAPVGEERAKRLCFFRTDIESTSAQKRHTVDPEAVQKDWNTLYNRFDLKLTALFQRQFRKKSGLLPLQGLWYRFTDHLMGKAVAEFSVYGTIETSRLHGHILACLLGKPNILLDNSYGKNSTYYRTWTHDVPGASLVPSEGAAERTGGVPVPAAIGG